MNIALMKILLMTIISDFNLLLDALRLFSNKRWLCQFNVTRGEWCIHVTIASLFCGVMTYVYSIERVVDIFCCNNERETALLCYYGRLISVWKFWINLSCFDSIVLYYSWSHTPTRLHNLCVLFACCVVFRK